MKKIFIITIGFILMFDIVSAQIGKGDIIFEPYFSFVAEELPTDDPFEPSLPVNESNLSAKLQLGYAISDKTIIGIIAGYSFYHEEPVYMEVNSGETGVTVFSTQPQPDIKFRDVSLGAYIGRIVSLSDKFSVIPRLSIWHENHIDTRTTDDRIDNKTISNYIGFELSGSLLYQVNNWLNLQAKLVSGNFLSIYDETGARFITTRKETNIGINPLNWEFGVMFLF